MRRAALGPRFYRSAARVAEIEIERRACSPLVAPDFTLAVVAAKESDNRILECAVAAGAGLIVTGDRRHLLPLGAYRGVRIVSPADFLRSR